MTSRLLMGNEAFAHGALEAGVRVIAGYPGTPSSELVETVARMHRDGSAHDIYVEWSVNEKAALELAFAASLSGARALFTCKQVGLNVASDALMSLNYVGTKGGLVLFVADDPGPISSQTEQDTRRFASFAKVPVLDPATPEQGFEMMKTAFELSEKYRTPVIVRPTTRINHASTYIDVQDETTSRALEDGGFARDPQKYVIFPKRAFEAHGQINDRLRSIANDFSTLPELACFNPRRGGGDRQYIANTATEGKKAAPNESDSPSREKPIGIVAGGVTTQYALEALDLISGAAAKKGKTMPSYEFMQIGTPYPFPESAVKDFLQDVGDVLVLEELDFVLEDGLLRMCGSMNDKHRIFGKTDGSTNDRGENSTEICARDIARFLDVHDSPDPGHIESDGAADETPKADNANETFSGLVEEAICPDSLFGYRKALPIRPPILCAGCPHRGSFYAVNNALKSLGIERDDAVFCGDIGCYTLGNTPPLDAVDTCLCMGGGFTMAQGIATADPAKKAIAFIGDSTFFASGMTGVANAVYNDHDITFCILDNSTTAMTGMQPHPGTGITLMGGKNDPMKIEDVLRAIGIERLWFADPLSKDDAAEKAAQAIDAKGPTAVIFQSPCIWLKSFGDPAMVDTDACTGCKKCITEIGCPAIWFDSSAKGGKSRDRGQAVIDPAQCNGCGLCVQICPFTAISNDGERGCDLSVDRRPAK